MDDSTEVCPKCGSTDISYDPFDKISSSIAIGTNRICKNCGLKLSSFPIIAKDDLFRFRKSLKKRK